MPGRGAIQREGRRIMNHTMKHHGGLTVILGALAIVALLAGCSTVSNFISVNARHYLSMFYPPTDPASVEILRSDPTRPNVRLGEVILEPEGNQPVAKMEQKIREASAKMGANAAVIVADTTKQMGALTVGPRWERQIPPEGRETIAVAIRYQRDE
jgi:hypothetical protein